MRLKHFFLILGIILIWGFNFAVVKVGLVHIPPLFLVFLRFFLTSIPLIFFVKKPDVPIRLLFSYGVVMFALQFGMLFSAMQNGITAGLASILLQVQVFFALALAAIVFKEKLFKTQILGAVIAFLGIALIGKNLGDEITLAGFILVIGAACCSAPGNALSKKMGNVDMLGVVVWSSFFAWPCLLIFSLYFEGYAMIMQSFQSMTWKSCSSALYVTYLSTLLGYYVWNDLIAKYSVGKIAPFTLLSPVFGMISSTLIFKEPLPVWKLFSAMLILTGLGLHIIGPKLESQRLYKKD